MMPLRTTLSALTLASAALLSSAAMASDVSNPVTAVTFDASGAAFFGHLFTDNNAGNTFADQYSFTLTGLKNLTADVFSYSANPSNGLNITSLDLYTAGGTLVQHGTQLSSGQTELWSLASNSLAADSYYLQISGAVQSNAPASYLAGATVTAVPEPETYGMLLGGLAVVSLLARRRQRS
ncbi:MAG: FxDxF family PEP-CTERM protein [Sphingomonadaceae bacterium]